MQKRKYKTGLELTDKEWNILEPFLPEPLRSPKGGQIPAPNRACIEGILWLLRSGARYKDVPKWFPSGSTLWFRLKFLCEQGVLLKFGRLCWECWMRNRGCIGKSVLWTERFRPHCACCRAKHEKGASRRPCLFSGKEGKGTKIMVVAEGRGVPLGVLLSSATPNEVTLIEKTLQTVRVPKIGRGRPRTQIARLIYDKAADSDPLRLRLKARGTDLINMVLGGVLCMLGMMFLGWTSFSNLTATAGFGAVMSFIGFCVAFVVYGLIEPVL